MLKRGLEFLHKPIPFVNLTSDVLLNVRHHLTETINHHFGEKLLLLLQLNIELIRDV